MPKNILMTLLWLAVIGAIFLIAARALGYSARKAAV